MPHPRGYEGLEPELLAWKEAGVNIVVSMLPLGEAMLLGLAEEEALCHKHGMEFHNLVVSDMQTPSSSQALVSLAHYLQDKLEQEQRIAIHCRMGIGRASVMAASVLVARGESVAEAFARISQARGLAVPDTPAQVAWVEAVAPLLSR